MRKVDEYRILCVSILFPLCGLVDLSNCSALVTLESYVFSDCSNLTSVGLAGCTALTTIGEGAFNNNYSSSQLSDFDFSQLTALKDIGESAFSNSAWLVISLLHPESPNW